MQCVVPRKGRVQVPGAESLLPERPFETVPDMMDRRWAEGLQTPRLMLLPSGEDLANEAAAFHRRNAEHLARWEPPTSIDLGSEQAQRTRLAEFAAAAASGTALHWWLQPNQAPSILVGHVSLMNIAVGPFQNPVLGYALDSGYQGRGFMSEALRSVIACAFSPLGGLRRIQAYVWPENVRSLRLLDRLGFERVGSTRDLLFIDGAWRDQIVFALHKPGAPPEA